MRPEHRKIFLNLTAAEILALCIYFESRGETEAGRRLVASVVLNRADHGGVFGSNIHDVITMPYQFSWLNSSPPQTVQDPQYNEAVRIAGDFSGELAKNPVLMECLRLAEDMLEKRKERNTVALHYLTRQLYNSKKCPKWARVTKVDQTIGNHVALI